MPESQSVVAHFRTSTDSPYPSNRFHKTSHTALGRGPAASCSSALRRARTRAPAYTYLARYVTTCGRGSGLQTSCLRWHPRMPTLGLSLLSPVPRWCCLPFDRCDEPFSPYILLWLRRCADLAASQAEQCVFVESEVRVNQLSLLSIRHITCCTDPEVDQREQQSPKSHIRNDGFSCIKILCNHVGAEDCGIDVIFPP